MRTGDPCRAWRETLGPGHKPRWGLFFPAVTREQSPTLPCNSNGRLDFPGPTEEEAWISRCNSRIPPQLEKNHIVPYSSQDAAIAATASQKKSYVPSWQFAYLIFKTCAVAPSTFYLWNTMSPFLFLPFYNLISIYK